jgi:acetyl esterase
MQAGGPGEDVAEVRDLTVSTPDGPIPARAYIPYGETPLPVVVFFHGGGWVIGSIETHDAPCRELANRSGAIVVSVEYRLAPEHPFPAAPEDCYAATSWVAEHASEFGGDPSRLAVAGDSAGGNLSAVVALMAVERGGPPLRFQLLIYPATDFRMGYASIDENGNGGYFVTKADMHWFFGHYGADPTDWRASPLLAPDHSGLPPALVLTAEYDPLRDEGEAYARKLEEAGVPVTLRRYDGQIHGFLGMTAAVDRAREAVDQAAADLRQALATPLAAR